MLYAEVAALAVSVGIGLISGLLALRQWYRRSRKERIDVYYGQISDVTGRLAEASDADLHRIREELARVRRDAFDDLVAERLEANESFTIFQEFLRAELAAIDARLGTRPESRARGGP